MPGYKTGQRRFCGDRYSRAIWDAPHTAELNSRAMRQLVSLHPDDLHCFLCRQCIQSTHVSHGRVGSFFWGGVISFTFVFGTPNLPWLRHALRKQTYVQGDAFPRNGHTQTSRTFRVTFPIHRLPTSLFLRLRRRWNNRRKGRGRSWAQFCHWKTGSLCSAGRSRGGKGLTSPPACLNSGCMESTGVGG